MLIDSSYTWQREKDLTRFMKIQRTKNATRNIIAGLALRIYQILVPFAMRTIIIYALGVQYLGLSSLFSSVLQVLNLAELGVGSAMVYSMYKPIADDDKDTICALMRLYKLYYRVIGLVVAVVGGILIPFIPKLISGNIPLDINIYVLYTLNLGASVLSYWLFAYKNCLFDAHQRTDVTSIVKCITDTIQYIFQIVAILYLKSYYMYLIVALITQILNNISVSIIAQKFYPNYLARGKLDKSIVKDINQRIKDLFCYKVGSIIINSADTIVISAFLGLTFLAIYQNYFYILNSIQRFISIFLSACLAGIGNSIITESKKKNYNDFKKLTFLINWILGFCTCSLLCLYQPFMKLWMGDELILNFSAVICFCMYFYIYVMNSLFTTFKDAAGLWHQDRFRPMVNAFANLALNLIMVQFWGIYGVLLSTVITMVFIGVPWLLHNLFTYLFERSYVNEYLKMILTYMIINFASCICTLFLCNILDFGNMGNLVYRAVICCVIPNLIFFISYRKTIEFKESIRLLNKVTNGRLSRANKM